MERIKKETALTRNEKGEILTHKSNIEGRPKGEILKILRKRLLNKTYISSKVNGTLLRVSLLNYISERNMIEAKKKKEQEYSYVFYLSYRKMTVRQLIKVPTYIDAEELSDHIKANSNLKYELIKNFEFIEI